MSKTTFWASVSKTMGSLLFGGALYAIWLAAFLLAVKSELSVALGALFFMAPVITAAGFTAGLAVFERKTGFDPLRSFVWPLAGCIIGAASVYWYGPMLISSAMLAGGTLGVIMRELMRNRNIRHHTS